ncbi:MAG: hypothetical protein SF069_07765 [Phycisphaerae bacterium]|nr:hypothetical protein [Phycisphaerae bacterium]
MRPSSAIAGRLIVAGAAGLLFFAAGCPQSPPADDEAPDPNSTISFANQVQPILSAECASCHRAGGFAALTGIALRLDSATNSFNDLTTLRSGRVSGAAFVVAGDPDASYFFEKINDDDPRSGARMPLGDSALTENQIETIRLWILQGAADN